MRIRYFLLFYFCFSFVYFLFYSLAYLLEIQFWADFLANNKWLVNSLQAVTYAGPLWFVIILMFSLMCRFAVRRFGENFTQMAIKSNMQLGVFKEIVRFDLDE